MAERVYTLSIFVGIAGTEEVLARLRALDAEVERKEAAVSRTSEAFGRMRRELIRTPRIIEEDIAATRDWLYWHGWQLRAQRMMLRQQLVYNRAAFWTVISTMFVGMAFQRLSRLTVALSRRYEMALRTSLRLRRAQEELREATLLYGIGSEEVRRAQERLILAQVAYRRVQEEIAAAQWEAFFGAVQFAFGLGTLLLRVKEHMLIGAMAMAQQEAYRMSLIYSLINMRAYSSAVEELAAHGLLHGMVTAFVRGEIDKLNWEQIEGVVTSKAFTSALRDLTLQMKATAGATGLLRTLTIGLTGSWWILALTAGLTIVSFLYIREQMRRTEEEMRKMMETLEEGTRRPYRWDIGIRRGSPIELRTPYGWVEVGEIPPIPARRGRLVFAPISINIQATLKTEEDIRTLAREVSRRTAEELVRITGKW